MTTCTSRRRCTFLVKESHAPLLNRGTPEIRPPRSKQLSFCQPSPMLWAVAAGKVEMSASGRFLLIIFIPYQTHADHQLTKPSGGWYFPPIAQYGYVSSPNAADDANRREVARVTKDPLVVVHVFLLAPLPLLASPRDTMF